MSTEKKNQHYIPKFYLRNFSYENNKRQIGIYHIENDFFYPIAKLKTQGSKTFYYGHDGVLENKLSKVEGLISKSIRRIITTFQVPKANSEDHTNLLYFIALTDLRNPVAINQFRGVVEKMRELLLKEDPRIDIDRLIPPVTHQEAIEFTLSPIGQVVSIMTDLDFKLIVNETDTPFISSDFPVVKYNRFLEKINWQQGKTGYGTIGLQIFMPLDPKLMIMFFDRRIYKVGNKKDKSIEITLKKDVDKLNELQVINCFTTLFFNEEIDISYVKYLLECCSKYQRANVPTAEMSYLYKPGEEINTEKKKNLIVSGATECETQLDITGIKMHSGSKKIKKEIKNSTSVALMRRRSRENYGNY